MANLVVKAKKVYEKDFSKKLNVLAEDTHLEIVDRILKNSNAEDLKFLKQKGFNIPDEEKTIKITKLKDQFDSRNTIVTISSIKTICLKYDMKFLPIKFYNGVLPSDITQTIKDFEKGKENITNNNYYMLAPKESFFTEKVKINPDPVLFYVPGVGNNNYNVNLEDLLEYKAEVVKVFGSNFTLLQRLKGFYRIKIELIKTLNVWFSVLLLILSFLWASYSKLFTFATGVMVFITFLILSIIIPLMINRFFITKYRGRVLSAYLEEWKIPKITVMDRWNI